MTKITYILSFELYKLVKEGISAHYDVENSLLAL